MQRGTRRVALVALLLTVVVLFAGCWDLEEVEDLGLILALAVDRLPGGEVCLLAQVPNPAMVGPTPAVGGVTPGTSIGSK